MTALDTLEQQLRDAAARRRRRRFPRLAWLLAPVAAAAAALAILGGGNGRAPEKEAVAPAPVPTFVTVAPDKIVYVRTTVVDIDRTSSGDRRSTFVSEEWHRGRETHQLESGTNTDASKIMADRVVDAHGTMRQINEEGKYRVIRGSNTGEAGRDAANVIARDQVGFLANFQRDAQAGILDRSAGVTFNGRAAYRYHVAARSGGVPNPSTPDRWYYVDRATGEPLGFTSRLTMGPGASMIVTQTVNEIDYLDPTPENLAKLRELKLKRRG